MVKKMKVTERVIKTARIAVLVLKAATVIYRVKIVQDKR
jgi:hypothetical protein